MDSSEGPFQLSQQQLNTLHGNHDLAAWVQDSPRDRLAWVRVEPQSLKTYTGHKTFYRGTYLEITFDSFLEYERSKAGVYEGEEYLMVTKFRTFHLETLDEVHAFLHNYVKKVEWVDRPYKMSYPNEFLEADHDTRFATHYNFQRRRVVRLLICALDEEERISVSLGPSLLVGKVIALEFSFFKLRLEGYIEIQIPITSIEPHHLKLEREGVFITPSRFPFHDDISELPIWDTMLERWEMPSDEI